MRSNKQRACVLKPRVVQRYLSVNIVRSDGNYVHRPIHALVLLAFAGARAPGQVCRHLNGDSLDNRLSNLRWGTALENAADREAHGRTARGARNGAHTKPERRARGERSGRNRHPDRYPRGEHVNTAKLTADEVREIRAAMGTVRDLAKAYGISKSMVSYIRRGEFWRHVD